MQRLPATLSPVCLASSWQAGRLARPPARKAYASESGRAATPLKKRKFPYYLKSAIAYLAAASRRRVCCRSKLLQTPCNTEDAVKGAIPKGTNFKNFFYFHTQQYDASQNIHSIC
jgi:hypothetical protein